MCGIFGYYTFNVRKDLRFVLASLFGGLHRLEYRGYDSAGVCIDIIDAWPCRPDAAHRRTASGSLHAQSQPASIPGSGVTSSAPSGGLDQLLQLSNGHAAAAAANATAATAFAAAAQQVAGEMGIDEVAAVTASSSQLIIKEVGKVEQLERLAYDTLSRDQVELDRSMLSQVGIAHTRWATHGSPSPLNSHPHASDPDHEFVVVHNGIITNFKVLKDFLLKNGEVFLSETDTEVIPKLCRYVYHRLTTKVPFPKLVMEVLKKLEGAYAVLVKSSHYPGELVACKRGSPMIMGIREGTSTKPGGSFTRLQDFTHKQWRDAPIECWVASDASAVIEHTKRVLVLEDNDVLHLSGGGYGIYNTEATDVEEAVSRQLNTLQLEVQQIMKGGYAHYMQKEIHEQPESLSATLQGRVHFQRPDKGNPYLLPRVKLGGLVEHGPTIMRSRRIMLVACGTSYHAGLASRQTLEEMCDVPVVLELASDLLDRRCPIFRDDTCVFISQSGETADTLRALEYAKERGALCMGITNTVGSAISRSTHCGIHLNAGYEIGVASTKAYTSQILALTMMALQLAEDSISKRELRDTIIDELGQLSGKVKRALALDGAMKTLAAELAGVHSLMFFARGYNYATALEAALKTKEVAIIHSEGILAGEMKHGPLALVDEHLPIVVIATRDSMYNKMDSVIQQLLARSAQLIILCNEGDANMAEYASKGCKLIQVPETVDALQPVVNIVPLQLLSYYLALVRGHNVDQPRNLAKSVTVSEEH